MNKVYIAIYVYGLVQGVGFRYSTQVKAIALGLSGFARNLDDGGVEIVACGDPEQVNQLLDWLNQGGPRSARIERLLTESKAPADFDGFRIRH